MNRFIFPLMRSALRTPKVRFFFSEEPLLQYKNSSDNLTNKIFTHSYDDQSSLTPKKVVQYLDRFIIGQNDAKKAIAIAFRNRWRRKLLSDDLKCEITPKNLLIQGPTGCGKSEIARRLAKLTDAPFLRVEATKYTEVGYVGKDIRTSDILNLAKVGINNYKVRHEKFMKNLGEKIKEEVYMQILDGMIGSEWGDKEIWKKKLDDLKAGHYDEQIVTILPGCYTPDLASLGLQPPYPPQRPLTRSIKQIYNILYSLYYEKLKFMYSNIDFTKQALKNVEEEGIIFLDQIDKLAVPDGQNFSGKGVSTEGVQRDLLPLIQGSIINTKYGDVKTDHILFIASGSFSMSKVDDLIPQLLGRLPIRVLLNPIDLQELERILLEPEFNLLMQQENLLKMEGVNLQFDKESVRQMALQAFEMNQTHENLGARRLHAIVEKVMQEISFNAPEHKGKQFVITNDYVKGKLKEMNKAVNLSKFLI